MTVETMSKSAALYERAKRVLPGGVSRNTVLRSPHPYYAAYGQGCRVIDIEGVEGGYKDVGRTRQLTAMDFR